MGETIAVVAAGQMGAAVGARLAARGARVLTSTVGRSAATADRARAAGMAEAADAELAAADVFLSIVPPDQAVPLATRLAGPLAAAARRAVYVDCNAVSPRTTEGVHQIVAAAGATYVDAGIIGGPPAGDDAGPTFYLSGPDAEPVAATLARHGLTTHVLDAAIGTASALKLSYAGITKGTTALAAAMVLAATRAGVSDALRTELAHSQPHVLARLTNALPGMLPKAYRWAPEMREIADYLGHGRPEADLYRAMAAFYAALADDVAGDRTAADTLARFSRRT